MEQILTITIEPDSITNIHNQLDAIEEHVERIVDKMTAAHELSQSLFRDSATSVCVNGGLLYMTDGKRLFRTPINGEGIWEEMPNPFTE